MVKDATADRSGGGGGEVPTNGAAAATPFQHVQSSKILTRADSQNHKCQEFAHQRVPVFDQRVYSDGRTADYQQGWLSWAVSVTTLTLYVGWIPALLLLWLFVWVPPVAATLAVLYSTLLLRPLLHWRGCIDGYILRTWREYFNFSYYMEGPGVDQDKNYILAEFPHGAFPMGPLIAAGAVSECLYRSDIYGLGASVLFWIPGYYHFMTWIGVQPASKANFHRLLKRGWVAVIVGGIAEMFMMREDREQIYLRRRKGIVRMAVETGHDIVPIYHFGNTSVLSFGPAWLKNLSRRLRASVGLMYGRCGLPIPRPAPIMMACGLPVPAGPGLPKDHPDFDATVDKVHQQLVDAMQQLYDNHKAMYGWADKPLVID
eukprot:jgi/Tetstr1/440328/TSEL_028665.t1